MNRGVIFSLDAALALIVVMAMGTLLMLSFQNTGSTADGFRESDRIASDSAKVGLYLDKSASEMGLSSFISGDANFGACAIVYEYGTIRVDVSRATVVETTYCKGI